MERLIRDKMTTVTVVVVGDSKCGKTQLINKLANGSFSGTIPQILGLGDLLLKVIVSTGEFDDEVKNLIGNKVLGYGWNATDDNMAVSFPVFLCKKKRKVRSQPALPVENLSLLDLLRNN